MHDDVRLAKIVSKQSWSWTVLDYSTRDLGFNSCPSWSSLVGPFGPGPAEPKALAFCHMNKSTEGKIPKYVKGYFRLQEFVYMCFVVSTLDLSVEPGRYVALVECGIPFQFSLCHHVILHVPILQTHEY